MPVENEHHAFCARGCYRQFYFKHYIVCEYGLPTGSTVRRLICKRAKCKSAQKDEAQAVATIRGSLDAERFDATNRASSKPKKYVAELSARAERQRAHDLLAAHQRATCHEKAQKLIELQRWINGECQGPWGGR